MKDKGWISIHRQLKQHWLWKDAAKLQWWLDILLSVNTHAVKINIGNDLIECQRGQTIKSLQTWAIEWKTSKDRVRNFFKLLEKDGMVTIENIQISTRLTVCNYDSYQGKTNATQTQDQRNPNATQTTTHPNNNVNNKDNKISIDTDVSEMAVCPFKLSFDQFRQKYPGTKRGLDTEFEHFKKKAGKEWKEILPTLPDKLQSQKNGRAALKEAGKFTPEWKHLKTWINNRGWEEEIEPAYASRAIPRQRDYEPGFDSRTLFGILKETA